MFMKKIKTKIKIIFSLQKVKVNVVLADRESNKLIFSGRPKEKDESIERKKNLMVRFFYFSFFSITVY